MAIENNQVVQFHYDLFEITDDGVAVEIESTRSGHPIAILMGHQNMLAAVEAAMLGRESGDDCEVELLPEQAFGPRHENAIQRVPIKHLITKGRYRVGQLVKVNSAQGPRDARIVKVGKFNVDIDANHPLAGKTVRFNIHVVDVRDATEEEISHGHAHGDGGHQH